MHILSTHAEARFPNPRDAHLSIVLCEIENTNHPFVVWTRNDKSFEGGTYCETLEAAKVAFIDRALRYEIFKTPFTK